jgi:leader peptidase (prepilin peptidase)/N-methyltransferase
MAEAYPLAILSGLFGLLIGSFLNVCISRLPNHESVVRPRSRCPHCKHQIKAHDNIPVLSYVFLGGRCRACQWPIPWRYPAVEVTTAVLFAAVVLRFGITPETGKWLVFVAIMVVLFWTDLETRLLPDIVTRPALAVGLLMALFVPLRDGLAGWLAPSLPVSLQSMLNALFGAILLSLPLMLIAKVYASVRNLEPPGAGDIKLLGALGAFLGLESGLVALLIGSVSGTVIGLSYILGTGKNPRKELLPFGTFLCGASVVVVFWGQKLLKFWWNS